MHIFTWLDAVAQRQRLRRVADKAVRRWVRLQLAATWSAWLQALPVSQDVGAVSRECASTKVLKRSETAIPPAFEKLFVFDGAGEVMSTSVWFGRTPSMSHYQEAFISGMCVKRA